jgi:hypothetical protein
LSSRIAVRPRRSGDGNVSKVYLRKRQVAKRYGNIALRSVERAAREGRIPPPEYPFGEHTPLWDLAKLEANERSAAIRGSTHTWQHRFLAELATAPRDQAAVILHRYKDLIDALPADEREKLLADAQDIISENPNETD